MGGQIRMNKVSIQFENWFHLYDAAIQFKQLKCWKWLSDEHVFGIQNPANGEIGYCCVLGQAGEVYGLAVYLGNEGLASLLKMQSGVVELGDPELVHMQRCLTVTYENRNQLHPKDAKVARQLGYRFKGRNQWPCFRVYEPGYAPWFFESKDEAAFMTMVLQQAIEVATRFKDDPDALLPTEKGEYLVRALELVDGEPHWMDHRIIPNPLESTWFPPCRFNELRAAKVAQTCQQTSGIWEVDYFYFPSPVGEGERPFFPLICFFVDHRSGVVLHHHLARLPNDPSEFADELLEAMERTGIIPKEIWVSNKQVAQCIGEAARRCGSVCVITNLPVIQEVRQAMYMQFGNDHP